MKILLYYESKKNITSLEVPDSECAIWVENDYKKRLEAADDKSKVKRRTPQQIMDEECNKITYNNNRTETRRHKSLENYFNEHHFITDGITAENIFFKNLMKEELFAAIEKLDPKQQELIIRIFQNGEKMADIAAEEGISRAAISNRLKKILKKIKKNL